MKDHRKTKAELLDELAELRQEVARLQVVEVECIELKQQMPVSDLMDEAKLLESRAAAVDVTERKQTEKAMQESEALFRRVMEQAADAFFVINFETRAFVDVNQRACESLGYTRQELLTLTVPDIEDTFDPQGFAAAEAEMVKGKIITTDGIHRRKDGTKIPVEVRTSLIETEERRFMLSLARNVTERRQAEEALAKHAAELETVAQVGVAASTILETERLLQEVVDLTKSSFGLYHTHIYLLDETGETLNLAAGAGDAGRQMVTEGWGIPFAQEQSLVARAARARQGVIVNDVREASDWLPNPLLPDTRSELAVPMIARDRVIGVLDVQADKVGYFTDEDVHIQTTLAAQVAVAIENARLFEQERKVATELEEQARHLAGLNELSRELSQAVNELELFEISTRRIPEIIQADRVSIALLTSLGNNFDVLALEGEAGAIPVGDQVPVEGTALGKAVRENHIIITPNISDSDFPEHRRLAEQGLGSIMNVPLMASGQVIGVLSLGSKKIDAYDITDQSLMLQVVSLLSSAVENLRLLKQTRERAAELEETTTFLDTILDNIPVAIAMRDAEDLRYVAWNKANEELTGFKQEDVLNKHADDLFPKDIADELATGDHELLAGNKLVEVEQLVSFPDKDARYVYTSKLPILAKEGKPNYLLGISIDITDRKAAEAEREQLLSELSRLSAVVEATSDFVAMTSLDGQAIYVNPAGMAMIGRTGEDYRSLTIEDFQGPEETKRVMEEILPMVRREGTWSGELGLQHVDGYYIPTSSAVMIIRSEAGEPFALGTIAHDITERKQAEEALKASEAKYRTLFAKIIDPIFIFDNETNRFLDCNQSAIDRYGYTREELQAMTPYQLHPREELEKVKMDIDDLEDIGPRQYTHITRKGERFQVEISSTPLEYQGREAWMSIVRDITERKRAEAERERLLAEVEAAYRQYVRKEWEQFLDEQHQGHWRIEHQEIGMQSKPATELLTQVQGEVAREGKIKAVSGNGDNSRQAEATIVAPISLRGQVIGTLGLQDIGSDRQWTSEELALVETVSEQLALTIENLRLFDDTQQRATREKVVADVTQQIWASGELERVMQTAVEQLGLTLDASKVVLRVGTEGQLLNGDDADNL